MLKRLSMVVLLAAACGGGSKKGPETVATTGTEVGTPAGVQLALGEMKLIDVNKNKAILIHADGTIEFEGQKPAKVTADGKLVKIENGEVGFTLLADGSIKGPSGEDIGVTLGPDGAIKMGDKTVSLDDTGTVVGGNPDAPQMKVEGATDANLKRTAMFVLIALTAGASQAPAPDSSSSTTAPPAP